MKTISVIVLLLCLFTSSYAQQSVNSSSDIIAEVKKLDTKIAILLKKQLIAEKEYSVDVYKHRQETYYWQLKSSKIIFWVVIVIVFFGILFSALQFYISMKQMKINRSNNRDARETTTEIEASVKGLKISSPVLGVIILTISLIFFYLYLVHVYPIKEVKNIQSIVEEQNHHNNADYNK